MRLIVAAIIIMTLAAPMAEAAEKYKIRDDRRQLIGDLYDPGHNRRVQIRDARRNIIGYIERDGTVTDKRRRKVKEIELEK